MRISLGDRGDAVADIQHRLQNLGYDLGPTSVDGVFARRTKKAIKDFQGKCGLPETGEVDSRTWRSLVSATYALGDRAVYLRTPFFYGNDVCDLQERLAGLGFHVGEIDSLFGPATDAALRDFQHNYGLFPDAIVGPSTLAALDSLDRIVRRGTGYKWPASGRSALMALEGKLIGIRCSSLASANWQLSENPDTFYADMAYRVASFVELLGGEVVLCSDDDPLPEEAEAGFSFVGGGETSGAASMLIRYAAGDKASGGLAYLVEQKLGNFASQAAVRLRVEEEENMTSPCPTIQISCRDGEDWEFMEPMDADIFRQRVAYAVFDGLKMFLEGSSGT